MREKIINSPAPVALGDPYRFHPSAFTREAPAGIRPKADKVTGKVKYIHATHRYFTVEYELPSGERLRESFKF